MVDVGVDGSSIHAGNSQNKWVGLVRGLVATWCWVCIHRMNHVMTAVLHSSRPCTGLLLLLCFINCWVIIRKHISCVLCTL